MNENEKWYPYKHNDKDAVRYNFLKNADLSVIAAINNLEANEWDEAIDKIMTAMNSEHKTTPIAESLFRNQSLFIHYMRVDTEWSVILKHTFAEHLAFMKARANDGLTLSPCMVI